MNRNIGKTAIAGAMVIAILAAVGQSAHAQNFNLYARPDRASYVPGDPGTLTITIANTGAQPLQLNNITIFWPWAGFGSDGKWQGNTSSSSTQLIAAASGSAPTIYTFPGFSFTIPSWFGYTSSSPYGCPGSPNSRYGQFSSCIVVGTAGNRYEGFSFFDAGAQISQAIPTYTPVSLVSQAIPIATLVVLAIATVFLALLWTSSRRMAKKS